MCLCGLWGGRGCTRGGGGLGSLCTLQRKGKKKKKKGAVPGEGGAGQCGGGEGEAGVGVAALGLISWVTLPEIATSGSSVC